MSNLLKSVTLQYEIEQVFPHLDAAIKEMVKAHPVITEEDQKVLKFLVESRKNASLAIAHLVLATAQKGTTNVNPG